MKNLFFAFACAMLLTACNKEKTIDGNASVDSTAVDSSASGKKFEMYEMSEMAMLMEQMYVDNNRLKERIKSGDTIGKFPNHFLKIHSAVMTDPEENDAFFKEQAQNYIKAQELIYSDPKNAQKHFNDGVDACILCHEVKCAGPIARIKKLYIK
ncbi:MAG: hypothetical protein EOO50_04610 [Flavobacterium sp.]|uniref:hypothetical protein n=1 Tax=Flavobacterium sp. TaxID=239 RepID=UPI001208B91A|nr:hypothetical protein [Flavobacterium sp.]RZJ67571.1 MAG: hypothetical protein EOO50_04610 [Flavobacterium sp.]